MMLMMAILVPTICLVSISCVSTQDAAESEFSFTFASDAEGWTAGFADLPIDFDQSIYELDFGYRPLPDGLEGNGVYIQGHNRSDDLFMFFKRQVDGLRPNTAYSVSVSLDLVTNVPAGLFGIGGSPGESVFVKAGASTVEPTTVEDNIGYLRMNIDKGNQANGGESMVVLGNVAHAAVTGEEYRTKTLDNTDRPVKVTTDSEGRVWLIVGTDSGFEGLSAFYFARIDYTLSIVEPSGPVALLPPGLDSRTVGCTGAPHIKIDFSRVIQHMLAVYSLFDQGRKHGDQWSLPENFIDERIGKRQGEIRDNKEDVEAEIARSGFPDDGPANKI